MQEPTRLFDLLEWRKALHPERPVFKFKENGEWKDHYIDEYIEKVNLISYALLHLDVQRGENIGLISAGRPEWNYVDFGVQQTGAVLLPIYPRRTTSTSSTTPMCVCWWSRHLPCIRKSATSVRNSPISKIFAQLFPWRA